MRPLSLLNAVLLWLHKLFGAREHRVLMHWPFQQSVRSWCAGVAAAAAAGARDVRASQQHSRTAASALPPPRRAARVCARAASSCHFGNSDKCFSCRQWRTWPAKRLVTRQQGRQAERSTSWHERRVGTAAEQPCTRWLASARSRRWLFCGVATSTRAAPLPPQLRHSHRQACSSSAGAHGACAGRQR